MLRVILAVAALALAGCSNATLSEVRPGLGSGGITCWATLNFKSRPKTGDVRDVQVLFNSIVLDEEKRFDWDYITSHDYQVKLEKNWAGEQEKFVLDESTTAESEVPIGGSLKVQFAMPSKAEVDASGHSDMTVQVALYWAGKKQDSASRGLFLAYQKK
jgi:hypothetical protein